MKSLVAAVAFMTRLPIGWVVDSDAADVSRSAAWFPLVGLLLGLIYASAAWLLRPHLPLGVVAVLLVALDVAATGALHYDGLADTADGFGGGKTREDLLRIMRDHAVGSYGASALACLVAFKGVAYAALLQQSDWMPAFLLAPALGRWSILLLTATLPYARTSSSVVEGMGKRSLLWGTVILLVALGILRWSQGWGAAAAVLLVTAVYGLYCKRRIGGITGDTLGANVQLSEAAALIAFLWNRSTL